MKCLFSHLDSSFCEVPVWFFFSFRPLFKEGLSGFFLIDVLMSSLDILDMNLLLDKWIPSMFSHYVLSFILLKVTFDKLKFLIIVKVFFITFSFIISGLLKVWKNCFPSGYKNTFLCYLLEILSINHLDWLSRYSLTHAIIQIIQFQGIYPGEEHIFVH